MTIHIGRPAASGLPRLAQAYAVVAAADLTGLAVSATTGLTTLKHSLLNGSAINAPIPFLAVQLAIGATAILWSRRRVGVLAAAALAILGAVSVLSGFADGSYSSITLTTPQRAIQLTLVAATALTVVFALQQLDAARGRPLRPPPRADQGASAARCGS